MEGRICVVIIIIAVASAVSAKDNEDLMCCPPSNYMLFNNRLGCYDPNSNKTVPIKLICSKYIVFYNFTVKSESIEYQYDDFYKVAFGSDVVCYGNMTNDIENVTKSKPASFFCYKKEEEYEDKYRVMSKSFLASVVFLSLTAIIYASFGELRDLFGKSIICFCGSMAIGLGILTIMGIATYKEMTACAIRGFLAYYFMVAAFFWSNSISIQVLRDTRRASTVDYGWKEFRWYALYSWGMPTILTTILVIVNYHPGNHQKPGIGLNHCWFITEDQQQYYLHSVITILLIVNFAIFGYIAIMLCRFASKSTHLKTLRYKLSMTIRLISIMGLPWLIEMIRFAVKGITYTWFIFDMVVALHGLLVFLVLVLRKRVVKVIHQHGLLVFCSGPVERWLAKGDDEVNVVEPADVLLREDYQTESQTQIHD